MTTTMTTETHATGAEGRALVLYDGDCPLCRRSVRLLHGLDWLGKLGFVNARDPERLRELPESLDPGRLLEEMHVLTPRGEVHHGFAAFRWMAWRLPPAWFLLPLLYVPGVGWLGQRVYLWVARNRFHLVPCHGGNCALPRRAGE